MKTDKVKKTIIKYFKNKKEISLVYLFGSIAENKSTPASDIDLAVLFIDNKMNVFSFQGKYMEELSSLLERKVDVVNLKASDIVFAYRVVSQGILLLERNKTVRFHLIIDLIRRYFDLKPSYDIFYRELGERARKGIIG